MQDQPGFIVRKLSNDPTHSSHGLFPKCGSGCPRSGPCLDENGADSHDKTQEGKLLEKTETLNLRRCRAGDGLSLWLLEFGWGGLRGLRFGGGDVQIVTWNSRLS